MTYLHPTDFTDFFKAIYGYEPFPWQRMLVERVLEHGWPEGIDLPTASGKTACIDVAVFVLALGEEEGRLRIGTPARRRIFFVVDRRIVVDEAYERASWLSKKLRNATDGMLRHVADRLRNLAGVESSDPLVVSRLRGGTMQDERWRLSPAQPAIITSTVDQIGSRLLFRSYGSSNLSAPIEAALTGCDSLILLDEAHCALPFLQTARAVQRYSGRDWIEGEQIVSPLTVSILSATLPPDIKEIFPKSSERKIALAHPELRKRISASKPAELVLVNSKRKHEDPLVIEAAERAKTLITRGHSRIAVMVNRVATAAQIAAQLNRDQDFEVVFMTGRMRSIDRDELVARWSPLLKAGSKNRPVRPIIVVTTQCLEVGADFSFDALVTECASFDSLRQRFGRLNRLGEFDRADAMVLIRTADVKSNSKLDDAKPLDPIYGNAMARTWNWLRKYANENNCFGFGIEEVNPVLSTSKDQPELLLTKLNAPSSDAPVMLPAHLDLLCQTAPLPMPDPDVAIFLHGPNRNAPEAHVVFRADLFASEKKHWIETVSLLPPLRTETLTVPLWLLRKWLAKQWVSDNDVAELSDVESHQVSKADDEVAHGEAFIIWRGWRESLLSNNPMDIRPNDTIVVPADESLAKGLGHAFCRPHGVPLDIAEQAYQKALNESVLRLLPELFVQVRFPTDVLESRSFKALFDWGKSEERESAEIRDLLLALRENANHEDADSASLPEWFNQAINSFLESDRFRILPHPAGTVILRGAPLRNDWIPFDLDFGDLEDQLSANDQSLLLSEHTEHVMTRAKAWATRCLPTEPLVESVMAAAKLHDLGKADPRFQIILHGDEVEAAINTENGHILAKSHGLLRPAWAQRRLRQVAGLPANFRHEMLSTQLAGFVSEHLPKETRLRELVFHLIASHHGHCRPFAPVCVDDHPPDIESLPEFAIAAVTGEQRLACIPPHRLDSGVAERFWQLTRYYGWWGLAYLECMLRLADRAASAAEARTSRPQQQEVFQ